MKPLLPLLAALLLIPGSGCARFHANLQDISSSTNRTGEVTSRKIITDLSGSAWFSARQEISKFKALQTDKSQSIGGTNAEQHGATNVVAGLEAATELIRELKRP
jgi:hypothetical protein